jgi:hypothetical protein
VRLAAHRLDPPDWARPAMFPVEVRREINGKTEPLKSVLEISRVHFDYIELSRRTPWGGQLPTSEENFSQYCDWLRRAGVDPEQRRVEYRPKSISPAKRHFWTRELMNGCGIGRPYADSVVKAAIAQERDCEDRQEMARVMEIARVMKKVILEGNHIILEPGLQTQLFVEFVLEAQASPRGARVVAPVCPAWSYNERGYTFTTVYGDRCGVCYDMMAASLEQTVYFFQQLGLDAQVTLVVGDVEWFDLFDGSYMTTESCIDRATFMERINGQVGCIRRDVEVRGLEGVSVFPLLGLVDEVQYLEARESEREKYEKELAASESERRSLANLITMERTLYSKQCACLIPDPENPPERVRKAAVDDIVVNRALSALMRSRVGEKALFLVESDPFRLQYKNYPHLGWRSTIPGA